MATVLVVEDDAELNRTVCSYLRLRGHEALGCLGAVEAFDAIYAGGVDLVVSDIVMPGTDGFGLAEAVRRHDAELPILFMTARDDMASKSRGYAAGIDDYLVKPFDLEGLALRVGALLRRAKVNASRRLEVGSVVLDADEHAAYLAGEPVELTLREFEVLWKLLANPRKAFTRSQLAGGCRDGGGSRAIDVHVAKLRKCFAGCGDFEIATAHGLGFTDAGGRVRVTLAAGGDGARVAVADTGCGIAPDALGRVFDKFYQADPSRTSAGNGLGLALVKRVVDLHGGGVHLESEPGAGSTFTVVLPARSDG